ncbi:hypothetical protein KY335_04945 [Candidatus Woesearchaeota archaeon]|nr:hypothetical protein [Candidatus Woesearchaeota archaeon]
MAYLEGAMRFLVKMGLLDVVLPFLLSFVLVYALLQKTELFGKEKSGEPKQRLNIVVALVASLLFVGLIQYTDFIMWFLFITVVIVGIIMFLLITKLFGVDVKLTSWIIIPVMIFFLVLFTYKFIDYTVLLAAILHPFTVFLGAVVIGIYFIVREPGKKAKKKEPENKTPEKNKGEEGKNKQEKPEYSLEEVGRYPADKMTEEFTKSFKPRH